MINEIADFAYMALNDYIRFDFSDIFVDRTGFSIDMLNDITPDDVAVSDLTVLYAFPKVFNLNDTEWDEDAFSEVEQAVIDAATEGTVYDAWVKSGIYDDDGLTWDDVGDLIVDITHNKALSMSVDRIIEFALLSGMADLLPRDDSALSVWKFEHLYNAWCIEADSRVFLAKYFAAS